MRKVYADCAATTPLCAPARKAMIEAFDTYGNPSSLHKKGLDVKRIIERARETVAEAINAEPGEIFFTSGATEANVWALSKSKFPLVSEIEHSSILNRPGRSPKLLEVSKYGIVSVPTQLMSPSPMTDLCSVVMVNNETGMIQPVKELCKKAHQWNMWFHTDATQAVGHIPVDVEEIGCDMLSMSAHKFGGPKGVGCLFMRGGVEKSAMLYGGGQERGLRAGTENVIGIAGMAAALKWNMVAFEYSASYMQFLRDRLIDGVLSIRGAHLTGEKKHRSPSIASFVFEDIDGTSLVLALDERGVCASSGSACHEGKNGISHVLRAMGYDEKTGGGSLRLSIWPETTVEDVDYIIRAVEGSVKELRT